MLFALFYVCYGMVVGFFYKIFFLFTFNKVCVNLKNVCVCVPRAPKFLETALGGRGGAVPHLLGLHHAVVVQVLVDEDP